MLRGLLIGALMSMLTMIFIGHPIQVTPGDLSAMLIMSALIGFLSMLFNIENLPFKAALPIHFILTAVIVFVTNYLRKDLFSPIFRLFIIYIVIYAGVWLLLGIWQYLDVQRINSYIKKRQKKSGK